MPRFTVRQRISQMEQWLRDNFPTPYPVQVRWVAKIAADPGEPLEVRRSGYFGECYWAAPSIHIDLSRRCCGRSFALAQETLHHEWCHAITMPNERMYRELRRKGKHQEHPDEFGLWYARIYRGWVDEGGSAQSAVMYEP